VEEIRESTRISDTRDSREQRISVVGVVKFQNMKPQKLRKNGEDTWQQSKDIGISDTGKSKEKGLGEPCLGKSRNTETQSH
jgi:hypothetical protein